MKTEYDTLSTRICGMWQTIRTLTLVALLAFALLLVFTVPAFAQTGDTPDSTGSVLTAVALVSGLVKLLVDRIRVWVPGLDGFVVNLVALALGTAMTWVPNVLVDPPETWVDRVVAGAMIAGVSSILAGVTSKPEPEPAGV